MPYFIIKITKTFNNGSLGSCSDWRTQWNAETAMRFAASVSHRGRLNTLWHLEMIQVYLFEQNIQIIWSLENCVTWKESRWDVQSVRVLWITKAVVLIHRIVDVNCTNNPIQYQNSVHSLSNQARLPAELKHISKREEKKLTKDSLSNGSEAGRAQI